MNALVIGRCPKTAGQLATFCDRVIIALDQSFERQRSLPDLDSYKIVYCRSNIKSPKGILPRAKEIRGIIKQENIDIVFSNSKWDMVAAKIAAVVSHKKVFLFATSHNSYAWQNARNVKRMSWLLRLTTDCYVALASFVANQLRTLKYPEKRLVVVPNTIDFETWEVKDDYTCGSTFRLVYVAYVYPGKRQDMIADVIDLLREKYDVVVDCYGDLEETDYVEVISSKIRELNLEGKLNMMGKIENAGLRAILKNYDAYFSASHMEMSPVNILEAQAAGLPVVAANVGGIPDLISDGETGLLFEADNIHSAAEKIEKLINDKDLREKLGKVGHKQVSEVYTKVQAGERLKSVITNM
jgi:glycosyltransferase involved in cell wall biosynthesis